MREDLGERVEMSRSHSVGAVGRRAPLLALFVVVVQSAALAQGLVSTMTPARIDEAIQLAGDEQLARRFLENYVLQSRAGWGSGPRIGVFTTPFSRVVRAALEARQHGKVLTAVDVPPELLAPELDVIATSQKSASDDTVVEVFSIQLVALAGAVPQVLEPLRKSVLSREYQKAHAISVTDAGVVAVFALTSLPRQPVVRVIFEHPARAESGLGRCQQCDVALNLGRIR